MTRGRDRREIIKPRLSRGDFFAWDTRGMRDGDMLYGKVLRVVDSFGKGADVVWGREGGGGGYIVLMFSANGDSPDGMIDRYGFDFVQALDDDGDFFRISAVQMEVARKAGWPSQRAKFLKKIGVTML